jgi:hypothetical protein
MWSPGHWGCSLPAEHGRRVRGDALAQRRCCGTGQLADDVCAGMGSAAGMEVLDAEPPADGLGRGAIVLQGLLGGVDRLGVLLVIVNIGADDGRVAGAGGGARSGEGLSREVMQLPRLDAGQALTARVLSGLLGSMNSGGSTMICEGGVGRGGNSQARAPRRRSPDVGGHLRRRQRTGSA